MMLPGKIHRCSIGSNVAASLRATGTTITLLISPLSTIPEVTAQKVSHVSLCDIDKTTNQNTSPGFCAIPFHGYISVGKLETHQFQPPHLVHQFASGLHIVHTCEYSVIVACL